MIIYGLSFLPQIVFRMYVLSPEESRSADYQSPPVTCQFSGHWTRDNDLLQWVLQAASLFTFAVWGMHCSCLTKWQASCHRTGSCGQESNTSPFGSKFNRFQQIMRFHLSGYMFALFNFQLDLVQSRPRDLARIADWSHKLRQDIFSYNSVISACDKGSRLQEREFCVGRLGHDGVMLMGFTADVV